MEDINELSHQVIGAAIEVHRHMGPGLLESVYQRCLECELRMRSISFISQHRVPLIYKNLELGEPLVLDLYFPNNLIVELKSIDAIHSVHEAQLLSYMKLAKAKLGLLINFNVPILTKGLKRMIL